MRRSASLACRSPLERIESERGDPRTLLRIVDGNEGTIRLCLRDGNYICPSVLGEGRGGNGSDGQTSSISQLVSQSIHPLLPGHEGGGSCCCCVSAAHRCDVMVVWSRAFYFMCRIPPSPSPSDELQPNNNEQKGQLGIDSSSSSSSTQSRRPARIWMVRRGSGREDDMDAAMRWA